MNRTYRGLAAAAVGLTAAGVLALPASTAGAASRTSTAAVDTTYLSDTLGLPSDTVIEPVTYDRFQWLLQQSGQYAFLIGSPSDANFKANAVAVDTAARTAGAKKVYWYDPNLSGYTGVRNLDTRKPAGINLAAASQTVYGNTWRNVLGQNLGNGIKSVPNATRTTATITNDDTVVNDAVNPLWDNRTGATPAASASDDVFFVYDKDRTAGSPAQPDKIGDWVNLSATPDTATVATKTTATFASVGGAATIDAIDQFGWWKDSANRKHKASYADEARYGGDVLTDADAADGWRVKQVTYPELLHALDLTKDNDTNFVVLFGGTWCHNTRAVLKDINAQAQDNDVRTVYNLDLVLDGGTVNGTNGGTNPLHVRDNANSGAVTNFRPSYVYGDLVRKYLRNVITEYDPNSGNRVSYYPGGDTNAFPDVVRKLQVPFLVNYQRGVGANPSNTAVKRQWIQQNTDTTSGLPTFREYMTESWFTHPSAQIGLSFPIPADESTLTPAPGHPVGAGPGEREVRGRWPEEAGDVLRWSSGTDQGQPGRDRHRRSLRHRHHGHRLAGQRLRPRCSGRGHPDPGWQDPHRHDQPEPGRVHRGRPDPGCLPVAGQLGWRQPDRCLRQDRHGDRHQGRLGQGHRNRREGPHNQEGRQLPGHRGHACHPGQGLGQGHHHPDQGQGPQGDLREPRRWHRHRQGAEARQGHLEGLAGHRWRRQLHRHHRNGNRPQDHEVTLRSRVTCLPVR